jgi:hypothetical protein
MQDLGYACSTARGGGGGVTFPEEGVRGEANRADNEWGQARKQRWQLRSVAQTAVRAWGEETPSVPESSAP